MLYCGRMHNYTVETALQYLPAEIFDAIHGKVAITMLGSDAFRLAQKIKAHDEVIVLSPWLFSYMPPGSSEADREWRYCIFCILHEVAHAFLKHVPPDELTAQKNQNQEDEADRYALDWYNSHAAQLINRGLPHLAIEEIRETQSRYSDRLSEILKPG